MTYQKQISDEIEALEKMARSLLKRAEKLRALIEAPVYKEEKKETHEAAVKKVLDYLNTQKEKIHGKKLRGFKPGEGVNSKYISARINEGASQDDFIAVIDYKCLQWKGTEFAKFLQPSTLFCQKHFFDYLNEAAALRKSRSLADKKIDGLMM